jgi:hypothetical protein
MKIKFQDITKDTMEDSKCKSVPLGGMLVSFSLLLQIPEIIQL